MFRNAKPAFHATHKHPKVIAWLKSHARFHLPAQSIYDNDETEWRSLLKLQREPQRALRSSEMNRGRFELTH